MRGTVTGFERTIGWASQERAFDTFLRLVLLARSAKQAGEEAGADAAELSTCAKFPANVRCSFSTERLRSRLEQLVPANRYPLPFLAPHPVRTFQWRRLSTHPSRCLGYSCCTCPARPPAPPSHLPSDAMGLCQSTQSLSVQRILAANAELAQLLFDVSRSCRELPATAGGPTSVALLTCHVSLLLANTAHGALYLSPPPTPGFLLAWRACSLAVSILIFTPGPARRDI